MTDKLTPTSPETSTPFNTPVYVVGWNSDVYEGPLLKEGDCFTTSQRASEYIGCDHDEIGAYFCYTKERGGEWGYAIVRGVHFNTRERLEHNHSRPPMLDPTPGSLRCWKNTKDQRISQAKVMLMCAKAHLHELDPFGKSGW